ncbi:dTDP-glucose 4,6-dehydratase [Prochlorococcus sp. MIT 1341]|uniref:dTDP-glucose 4,6-dehydratase n=1 Tax=Prochlorococcus sp. MIT 1341 TaxID=3096221 RepID=UPI002A766C0E|nr:dTDP-glucose 4,6-dehydratase [Prochlorococcus sp. MIT 1341]
MTIYSPEIFQINELLSDRQRILVTGGAGFIGGCLIRRLLTGSNVKVFNLDKCGYASNLKSIQQVGESSQRHELINVDLSDAGSIDEAIIYANPDIVFHLAAESHVDRSIDGPKTFLDSNVIGTFNLLQAIRKFWESLPPKRKGSFRLIHISTDEVFGSLGNTGYFSEDTPYNPSSPYAATKAASDHLVRAWNLTYGLPVVVTNCSNNYGPWQFPEKLIPLVILKALKGKQIPLYGDGMNTRDWLYVEDHVDALLLSAIKGEIGKSYCVGGNGECTNKQIVYSICSLLDAKIPNSAPHSSLISFVQDRPGHDFRYSIDSKKIQEELDWRPRHSLEEGLKNTVEWYCNNLSWCNDVVNKSGYDGQRMGHIN